MMHVPWYGLRVSNLIRFTLNLIPQANRAAEEAMAREGLNKADILNRGAQLYNLVSKNRVEHGKTLALIDVDGTVHEVHIL